MYVSSEKLRAITEEYTRLNLEIEKFKVNKNDPRSQEWINTIEAETAALKRNIQELLNKGSAEVSQEANTANLISGTIEYERAMKKLNDTLKQAETSHNNWTKAKNGKSSVAYDNIADVEHLPVATSENKGAVKSTTKKNGVSVAEDGTMEVNSLSVGKLTQEAGSVIVIRCGSATE